MSEPVFFWGGIYSQWYRSSIIVGDDLYRTAEHWMMAEKARLFNDHESLAAIMKTRDPSEAKRLGRQIKGWDEEKWKAIRFQTVCRGSYEKFRQNDKLREQLLETGGRDIVEASPTDKIWGIGLDEEHARIWYDDQYKKFLQAADDAVFNPDWPGLNLLGKALCLARAMLTPR